MFIIKVVETATKTNENFEGQSQTWYIGKQERRLSQDSLPAKWLIDRYGFKTKAAASKKVKGLKEVYDWFENQYHSWTHSIEIVEA